MLLSAATAPCGASMTAKAVGATPLVAASGTDSEPRRDGGQYPTAGAGAAAGAQSDAHSGRPWGAEPRRDSGGDPTAGAGAAAGSQSDAYGGRYCASEPRQDGGEYPATGAGKAVGPHSARWDAAPDSDGPAAALLELGIASPVASPVPGGAGRRLLLAAILAVGATFPGDRHGVAGRAHVREGRSPL